MISITQIEVNNENKLTGEIGEEKYCISYSEYAHNKLKEFCTAIDLCASELEYTLILKEAKTLVDNISYNINTSKYFVKINDKFYITNGKKYYNIKDSNNLISNVLNFYIDKGLNIDKFAIYLVRGGKSTLFKLNDIYQKMNSAGNTALNTRYTGQYSSYRYTIVEKNTIIRKEAYSPRYFINSKELSDSSEYNLSDLNIKLVDVIEDELSAERYAWGGRVGLSVLLKPNLKCIINSIESNYIDTDLEKDWESYLYNFIDLNGRER